MDEYIVIAIFPTTAREIATLKTAEYLLVVIISCMISARREIQSYKFFLKDCTVLLMTSNFNLRYQNPSLLMFHMYSRTCLK